MAKHSQSQYQSPNTIGIQRFHRIYIFYSTSVIGSWYKQVKKGKCIENTFLIQLNIINSCEDVQLTVKVTIISSRQLIYFTNFISLVKFVKIWGLENKSLPNILFIYLLAV